MPKIPTFTAKGSIEQLAGTTSNIQMGLNNTLAGALAPVTEAVVNFKIKENEVQNKTEALKLKNDYLSETSDIGDQINQDKILSVNKVAANKFLKEKNNALIEKYAALATTQAAKTMFTNSALADVSKQIFSLDTDISRNILVQADEVFIDTKEKLFSKAYLKGGIYKDTLLKDTQQLIIDSYKSRVTFPELETMLGNVKGEIDYFDGMKDVQQTPRAAFYALKDEKNYSDITTKQRFALIERASVVIREQLTTEWENHTAMIDAGKKPPEFNMKLAQEVFGGEVANKMLQQESVRKDAVENTSLIMTSPQKNVNELVKNIIDEQYEMFGETQAKANEKYYIGIANTRNEKLETDPVEFLRTTNDDIDSLFKEIENDTNSESRTKSQKILAQTLLTEQTRIGVPLSKQKVMSNSMAAKFVTQYKELGFDGNSKARTAMLKSLDFQYGDLSDKALTQLMTAGLPKGTKVGLVLGTEQTIKEFMGFDDPKEVEALKNFLARQDDTDISLEKIKTAIVNQSDYGDIYNINRQNVPFDISGTITEMDEITDVLSLYAAKLMFSNPGMSVSAASKEASLLFSNNYRVEDTYFLPRKVDDRTINDRELDTHVKILDTIKYNYLTPFKFVAFKSNREDVSSKKLTEKMNYNLINNGEWRNSADGEGSVYVIVLSGNSFAIPVNEDGEALFVKHGDNSYTLPGGSGIEIDINLPSEQEKKQYRGYYGYLEKIKQEPNNLDNDGNLIGGKRENLNKNEMQNALEQAGASTAKITNPLSIVGEAMIGQVESSEINLNSAKRIILDKVGGDIYNEKSQNNLQKFTAAVFDVESNSGDKDFLLNKSSATGFFQFKTKDNLDKKTGKVKLDENGIPLKSSFETALSRLETQYKRFDTNIPNWVKKAKQTKNPTKFILEELTYDQQEELFLMNIYGQTNSDALIKAMLNGNMEKAMELYAKFHHTKLNVVNDETIKEKFNKAYK
jgi:hypothetical protein